MNEKSAENEGYERSRAYRPIKACTNCRQSKIRCNASERMPLPCSHCAKQGRKCVIDPSFRPKKGGQVEMLREDLRMLQQQMAQLQSGGPDHVKRFQDLPESSASSPAYSSTRSKSPATNSSSAPPMQQSSISSISASPKIGVAAEGGIDARGSPANSVNSVGLAGNAMPTLTALVGQPELDLQGVSMQLLSQKMPLELPEKRRRSNDIDDVEGNLAPQQPPTIPESHYVDSTFAIGDVVLTYNEALRLHQRFMNECLPFIPIMESAGPGELNSQSQLLFWTVMFTSALSEPTPELYMKILNPLKQLAVRVCWLETPRSTHVVQALLILSSWPMPNEKILDDPSYRFTAVAHSLGLQLGMHRGRFIYEFSRQQKRMPNAVKWRTRTWAAIYITEQLLSASLGLPSNMQVDYLINLSTLSEGKYALSPLMRNLLLYSIFNAKMTTIMGSNPNAPDGLLDAKARCPTLEILAHDLDQLHAMIGKHDQVSQVVYLYMKSMLCCFAFLPDTPEQDQAQFVVSAFTAATETIALTQQIVGEKTITQFPTVIRHAASFAALMLFRLHTTRNFPHHFVESARQSIVAIHALYRKMTPAWAAIQNDVTRLAKILESLNYVLMTHPYLITSSRQIISRMRSHLTFSLFYELIWAVHEARRRDNAQRARVVDQEPLPQPLVGPEATTEQSHVSPLPLLIPYPAEEREYVTQCAPATINPAVSTSAAQMPIGISPSMLNTGDLESSVTEQRDSLSTSLPDQINLLRNTDWYNESDDFVGWLPPDFAL